MSCLQLSHIQTVAAVKLYNGTQKSCTADAEMVCHTAVRNGSVSAADRDASNFCVFNDDKPFRSSLFV